MAEPLDFAFLDIEVTDGQTFEIALELRRNEVPFVFVSGARPEALPPDLRGAPFIPKPFERHLIARVLRPRSDQSSFRPPDPRERSTSQARAARRAGAGFSATVRAAIRRRSSMTTDPKRD
jgi:DNA-binding response OmpR family regulator